MKAIKSNDTNKIKKVQLTYITLEELKEIILGLV